MGAKIYQGVSGLLLSLVAGAQFTGFCFADYETVPDVPKTVRDNPAVYRSHYTHYYARIGGK